MNQPVPADTASEPALEFLTKKNFSQRMSWSLRTTDTYIKERKIPFCKLGKIVRIPWPEARDHLLQQYQIGPQ